MKKRCLSCGVQFVHHGENLDVVRTSRDQENLRSKGSAGESALDPHFSVVRHSPPASARLVALTEFMAANTFQSLKQKTSSRQSILLNRSTFPWSRILLFTGRALWPSTTMRALALRKFARA
jgi:hypothetical protein